MVFRSSKKPRYTRNFLKFKRTDLHRNLPTIQSTAWRRLLTFGTAGSDVKYGSPYRKSENSTGSRYDVESIDIPGLGL